MRPLSILLPGGGAAGAVGAVAAAQAVTAGTAMTLVGVAGGIADPFILDVKRQIALTFAASEVGNNFTIHGLGDKGNEQYETIAGTAAGQVETEAVWTRIFSITPEQDGAGNVSADTITNIRTQWVPVDYMTPEFNLGVRLVYLGGATGTVSVQLSHARLHRQPKKGSIFGLFPPDYQGIDTTNLNLVGATGDSSSNIQEPVTAVRLNATTAITGTGVEMRLVQGIRNVAGW